MIKPVFHLIFQVPAIILLLQLWSVDSSSSSSVNPIGLLNNRFGSCKIENAGRIHGQYLEPEESPNTWYYSNILPSQTEKEEYDKVNPSFSKTNKAYVLGLVNGTSQLKKFLRPRQTWQFPPDHPRQNKSLCYSMLQAALQPSILHEPYRESQKSNGLMYLLRASNVLIRGSGIFASSCGYYQPIEACETIMKRIGRIWWNKCSRQLKKKEITYQQLYQQLSSNSSTNQLSLQDSKRMCIFRTMTKDWQYVDQVFVLTAGWDSNYGHFIIDSLPRIIRFLPFLQDNPNIKIHIRFHEQFVNITMPDYHQKFTKSFRNGFFRVLNISSDRLIYGPIVARELYYPRPMTCASALIHPYELRLLSKTLKESVTSRLSKRMNHTTLNATSNRGVFLPFRIQKDVHQTQATSVLVSVVEITSLSPSFLLTSHILYRELLFKYDIVQIRPYVIILKELGMIQILYILSQVSVNSFQRLRFSYFSFSSHSLLISTYLKKTDFND